MRRKVTLQDIARKADVGIATVDRVLNGRAPVTKATADRVLSAARELGYHGQGAMQRRVEQLVPHRRLGFILQKKNKWFYQALADGVVRSAPDLKKIRATAEIRFVESLSPDDLAEALLAMADKADAIAFVSIDHPKVHAAIQQCKKRAVPVFSLLSPLSSPDLAGYIGIDGRKAGRTAGWAMARFSKQVGEIGILVGSHRYLGHEALEAGFRSALREYAPDVGLRDSLVYLDDAAVAYEATLELLAAAPDLKGLYHCGGGVRGVLKALRETKRNEEVFYICHEKSPHVDEGLLDGSVDLSIANPVESTVARSLAVMERVLSGKPAGFLNEIIDFQLITPENV
ncbi:MAG: LacI family DNA-binding transcriptional regulator [Roseibium sp.]|uniref:LacI family DNA-binding transcriptional regulator n=1 Tax=Roseibium sp. TaxID=1936156 RepID=UPI0026302CA1|nr:LacI family DNA-binding transcriptional regulator [Roseibium sp.]MCV0425056.1 LacI family DNA-binding transcriptional regulator [Roseibium sp.]